MLSTPASNSPEVAPVSPQRHPHQPEKITEAMAARLVYLIAELKECEDCDDHLSLALDEARAAISPWYDR